MLKECFSIMEEIGELPGDNYGFFSEWKEDIDFNGNFEVTTKIDEILKEGIKGCITLFNENIINL